jgi:cytidylate kinase
VAHYTNPKCPTRDKEITSIMKEIGSSPGEALAIVLTGVSGSGKSEVGQEVAKKLGVKFPDTDDFHSAANKDKMHRGIALTDDDRCSWLIRRKLRE